MMASLSDNDAELEVIDISIEYKETSSYLVNHLLQIGTDEKKELLDSLIDQMVTAMGVGHMMGFDMMSALAEVNRSNFSKLEDGRPVFDVNGKITKGKNYTPPELGGFINKK